MTQRLYYADSYRTGFDATVVATTDLDGRPAIALDQTCFYPTSGGQLHDTGALGEARVIDVIAADGGVLHVLDAPLSRGDAGQPVHGVIDWPRRYDHMQQHSGQHLISQVFYRLFGHETVSVHFGALDSTLDLDTAALEQNRLDEAERLANDVVYESRPIRAYFVTDNELARLPLRRPPAVTYRIRIVEIADFDFSACGGTHCRTTAEVGPIKFLRQERRRGQVRVAFRCGRRAYSDYVEKHRLLAEIANLFSTDVAQTPALVARNIEQNKELQRRLDALHEKQVSYEVEEIAQAAELAGAYRVVTRVFEDRGVDAVKRLANLLQARIQTIALLACVEGDRATVIFARAADTPLHMGNLLRSSLGKFGGGGGGRPEFAQGGAAATVLPQVLADAMQQIRGES